MIMEEEEKEVGEEREEEEEKEVGERRDRKRKRRSENETDVLFVEVVYEFLKNFVSRLVRLA